MLGLQRAAEGLQRGCRGAAEGLQSSAAHGSHSPPMSDRLPCMHGTHCWEPSSGMYRPAGQPQLSPPVAATRPAGQTTLRRTPLPTSSPPSQTAASHAPIICGARRTA